MISYHNVMEGAFDEVVQRFDAYLDSCTYIPQSLSDAVRMTACSLQSGFMFG